VPQQPPQSGTLEQVLRCLRLLALSEAFRLEMDVVCNYMGNQAFQPANFVDANGGRFSLGTLDDVQFGDPNSWVPKAFKQVQITQQLRPVPPYPHLELLGAPGRMQQTATSAVFEVDTGEVAGFIYVIDVVAVADGDRPTIAARRAMALSTGFSRLVRRNEHLGGLVQLIASDGPQAPGGEVERGKGGLVSGVAQRYRVEVLDSIF